MADFPLDLSKLNLSSILEMANQFREKMQQLEESLARIQVETVVGGGMVAVKANAKGEILAVAIDPELLAMKDQAMLENLVLAGVNQALAEAKARRDQETQNLAGGMVLPGWLG